MQSGCLHIQSVEANWSNPAITVYADRDKIHIWRIKISSFSDESENFKQILNAAETAKYARYKSAQDIQSRSITRAILKILLGRYLGADPQKINIVSDQQNKPTVKNPDSANFHFNVSHSGNWALIAISTNPTGIDLEQINASFTYQNLLDFSFNIDEKNYIQTSKLPIETFYKLWTRKEAILKATGQGLIDELTIIPSLDGLHQNPDQLAFLKNNWQITSFCVDENYTGSAAFMPVKTALQFFNFQL